MTVTAEPAGPLAGTPGKAEQRSTRRAKKAKQRKESGLAYLLLLPGIVLFGVFAFYPFLKNFYLGLYRSPPFPNLPRTYAGVDQYREVLTSHDFLSSLGTTIIFTLMVVPAGVFLGLLLAVAAHQKLKGIGVYRTIFSSTVATSVAVVAVIFGALFSPVVGLLPYLGLSPDPPILQNLTWALPGVAILTVWQSIGLSFIVISAGLQAVPDDMLEAARVDGAGTVRRFWQVTVPLLSPTLFFMVVAGTIMAFQTFGQIDLLTQGGPLGHTNVLTYFVYHSLQVDHDPGKAAVLSIALFFITLVLALVQMRVLEKRVTYA